ncbi:MAG TPA: VWA domain-containing protein [Polyangiales bacterium]|nr:VWA domain-containing protein [Polyangiales bacterium]
MLELDLPSLAAVSFSRLWLFLLLPLPYVVVRWLAPYDAEGQALRVPFFGRLTRMLGAAEARRERTRSWVRLIGLCLLWLLVLTALAGPEELGARITRTRSARDLLLAVDLSGSMAGTDLSSAAGPPQTRLDVVKQVVSDFVRARAGDRLGLVVFGDAPFLQVPFTTDTHVVEQLLQETEVGMAGPRTALGDALGLALRVLENSKAKSRVVIVLTDGNDTGSLVAPLRAARIAAERGVRLYVIGVGDPKKAGEESLNEEVLRGMADMTHGRYLHAQDRAELSAAYTELAKLEPIQTTTDSYQPKRSVAYVPLFGIAALLALQMLVEIASALLRGLRRAPHASEVSHG